MRIIKQDRNRLHGTAGALRHGIISVLTLLILTFAPPVQAQFLVRDADFLCGSHVAGHLNVIADDALHFFPAQTNGSLVTQCPDGSWTAFAGMRINALATAAPTFNGGHFAWMQAVVVDSAPGLFACVKGDGTQGATLTAPFADTPPGGYFVTDICGDLPFTRQVFDNEPWYGNNTIGQLSLQDAPKNGVFHDTDAKPQTRLSFESWLVCVTAADSGPVNQDCMNTGSYSVIPLMGFTWGFNYSYGTDNGDGTLGNAASEYTGTTTLGGLMQGGQPSQIFKDGYAKFFNINYLENNDANCLLCTVPEPGSLMFLGVGSFGAFCFILRHRKRQR